MTEKKLRDCSFKPEDHMIPVRYEDNQNEQLYLEVKYRVLWFNQYCEEHGINGYIDDSDVQYIPEAQTFMAKASIYMDDKLIGASAAGIPYTAGDPTASRVALHTAATFAKGRALANAGFGTVNGQIEEGSRMPCDSGITITGGHIVSNQENPMDISLSEEVKPVENVVKKKDKEPIKEAPVAQSTPQAPVNSEDVPQTIADAKALIMPIGRYKGKSVGEVFALDAKNLEFYAGEKFTNEKYPQIKIAAKMVLGIA